MQFLPQMCRLYTSNLMDGLKSSLWTSCRPSDRIHFMIFSTSGEGFAKVPCLQLFSVYLFISTNNHSRFFRCLQIMCFQLAHGPCSPLPRRLVSHLTKIEWLADKIGTGFLLCSPSHPIVSPYTALVTVVTLGCFCPLLRYVIQTFQITFLPCLWTSQVLPDDHMCFPAALGPTSVYSNMPLCHSGWYPDVSEFQSNAHRIHDYSSVPFIFEESIPSCVWIRHDCLSHVCMFIVYL